MGTLSTALQACLLCINWSSCLLFLVLNLPRFLCEKFGHTITPLSRFQNLGLFGKVTPLSCCRCFCGASASEGGLCSTFLKALMWTLDAGRYQQRGEVTRHRTRNHAARALCRPPRLGLVVRSQGRSAPSLSLCPWRGEIE